MLSVVIPAYNEQEMVPVAAKEIRAVLSGAEIVHELICVDDGSKDGCGKICDDYGWSLENF